MRYRPEPADRLSAKEKRACPPGVPTPCNVSGGADRLRCKASGRWPRPGCWSQDSPEREKGAAPEAVSAIDPRHWVRSSTLRVVRCRLPTHSMPIRVDPGCSGSRESPPAASTTERPGRCATCHPQTDRSAGRRRPQLPHPAHRPPTGINTLAARGAMNFSTERVPPSSWLPMPLPESCLSLGLFICSAALVSISASVFSPRT